MAADQAAITLAQLLKPEVLAVLDIVEMLHHPEYQDKAMQAQLVAALTLAAAVEQEQLVIMQV